MDWLLDLRLIRLFSFYLALIFVVSTYLRLQQYRAAVALVIGLRNRWPKLTVLVLAHRNVFLSWETIRPLLLVVGLLAGNMFASHFIWPEADLFTVRQLLTIWPAVPFVALSGLAMFAFDVWGTSRVGVIDQRELEKYFDQAEFWLQGWKAPAVRVLSLGYVNPRQIVDREVRSALESASHLVNRTLWWWTRQTILRLTFGLSLWSSYALQSWLRAVVGT